MQDAADRVVIRSYPKIVYLYPTLVAAIVAGIWSWASLKHHMGDLSETSLGPGRVFFIIFAFNMLVLAFDFSRKSFVAMLLLGAFLLTLGILLELLKVGIFGAIETFLGYFVLRAHPHFYLAIAFVYLILISAVFAATRFEYWEVRHNEILHYQGFMADVERFPAPGLRFKKQIPDVFEYALLRAGTIVIIPAVGEKQEIQNVPNVNVVESRLDSLLGTIQVQIQPGQVPPPGSPPAPPPLPATT
jgi:hypothetical protein